MKIKEQLEALAEKYDLYKMVDTLNTNREWARLWYKKTEKLGEKSIVIFGAGGGAKIILRMLIKYNQVSKVAYIVDHNPEIKELFGIEVRRNWENGVEGISQIWISSYKNKEEMKSEVLRSTPVIECVDPYEELEKLNPGMGSEDLFWNVSSMRNRWFGKRIAERERAESSEKYNELSRQLIAGYFCIYDWLGLKREISEYVKNEASDAAKYKNLLDETEEVLECLKQGILKRNGDVVMYVVDSVSNHVAEEMPLLKEWRKNAFRFTEYKCIYPGTREVFNSFLTGRKPFEHETFVGKKIKFSDSKLLRKIMEEGIKVKLICQNQDLCMDYRPINEYVNKYEDNALLSEVLFNGVCELLESEEKQLIIMHTDTTVHYPHYTPYTNFVEYNAIDEPLEEYRKNYSIALQYTDEQLQFYTSILDQNPNLSQIIMGDHGIDIDMEFCSLIVPSAIDNRGAQWNGNLINTELDIKSAAFGVGVCEQIVSSSQFCDILLAMIKGESIGNNLEFYKTIPLEWVPGWDYNYIQRGLKVGNYYYCIGAAGCMNKEYMYMNTEDGEDLYYRIEKEKVQLLTEPDTIEKAKQSLGEENIEENRFPNEIMNHPRFETHKRAFAEYREAHKEQ